MIGPRLPWFALLLLASPAFAASPEPALAETAPTDADEEEKPALIPAAADVLSGHLQLGASGIGLLPIAMLDGKTSFMDRAGLGVGAGADIGFGVSRYLSFGAFGEFAHFSSSSDCGSCSSNTFAVGPFVRYHLMQGARFDPWLTLGVGYRKLTSESSADERNYAGIDWVRVALGGDWYGLSQLSFGPYAQATLGTFTDRPSGSATVYGMVNLGLRIALDAQGR